MEADVLADVSRTFLEAQQIQSELLEGTWKCLEGAGVGLVHSFRVMDAVFLARAAVQLASEICVAKMRYKEICVTSQ